MTDVAILAVINNPDLKAQRSKDEVARAQLFAARLLPDPQLSLSTDHPTDNGPGLTNAYGVGLNYDIATLVTRGARTDMASAAKTQVDLDLLWQEWQVAQQARLLYVQLLIQDRELDLLRQAQRLYADRYARSAAALRQGDITLDVTGTDLTTLLNAQTKVSQIERQLNQTHHDLNALLGLAPDTTLTLVSLGEPVVSDAARELKTLKTIQRRRPDLLALQAGYRSQEAGVRRAILAQFPALSVGFTRARDTTGVHTIGLGITLNLPIFSANRGDIAIQRATRDQLWQEYQARLDQTYAQIDMLQKQRQLIELRRKEIEANLPNLERMAQTAGRAYEARDIDPLTYLNMQNTLVDKRIEAADLQQSQWDTSIALDTLLAWPGSEQNLPDKVTK
ncbi:MAG: TolC family protein [Sulfuricaulis sp.]